MIIRNWNFSLFNAVSCAALVLLSMGISAQLVSGQPQALSPDQLQSVTGGGDCEDCGLNTTFCKTANETLCRPVAGSPNDFGKRVYTGQNEITEKTGLDNGFVDADPDTPEKCYEVWTGCDKVNGSCVNCDSTSTTGSVNSNCHFADSTECPAS